MSYRGAGTLTGPLHLNAHASPGLSTAGEGRIYFDSGTNQFMVSENGGAYATLTTPSSAAGWTDDGTVVRLTTVTDRVGIGATVPTAGYKLEVLGDVTNPAIHLQSGGGGSGIQMESGTGEEIRIVADQNLVLFSGATAFLGTNAGTTEVRIGDSGLSQAAIRVFNTTEVRLTAPLVTINGTDVTVGNGGGDVSMAPQTGTIGGDATRLFITPNLGIILEIGNTIKVDPDGTNNWIYGDDAAVAATPGEPLTLRGGAGNTTGAGGELRLRGGAGGATGAGSNAVISGGAGGATSGAAGGATLSGGTPVNGDGGSITVSGSAGVGANRAGGSTTLSAGSATGSGAGGIVQITSGTSPSGTSGSIRFATGTTGPMTERGRFTPNGTLNLGDGSVNATWGADGDPGTTLASFKDTANIVRLYAFNAVAADGPVYLATRGRGTALSPTAVLSGDELGAFGVSGLMSATGHGTCFSITGYATQNFGPAATGSRMVVTVGTTGSGTPSERMSINGDGVAYFGDGTIGATGVISGSIAAIHAYRNTTAEIILDAYSSVSALDAPYFIMRRARGTAATQAAAVNGDTIGGISFQGATGPANNWNFADILCEADGAVSAPQVAPGRIRVLTTPAAGGTGLERVRVNSTGTVFVGNGTLATTYGGGGASFIPLLMYNGDASGANQYIRSFNTTVGSGSSVVLDRARGTPAVPAAVNSGDNLGGLYFAGASSPTTTNYTALIASFASAAGATSGDIRFSTSSASALVERARITDAGNVGVATTTPASTLDIDASVGLGNIQTISATTTLDGTDAVVLVDASGGAVTVNLPAAAGVTRRSYVIKKTDSSGNVVTVDASGAETIDGATTQTLVAQFDSLTIVCDGTAWFIV